MKRIFLILISLAALGCMVFAPGDTVYQNGGGFITFGGTIDLVILWWVVIFATATTIHSLYHLYLRKPDLRRYKS
jgi:hypothetical protein